MRKWINVLVVTGIILVGGGLLVVRVNEIRESANKATCVSRLKGIGCDLYNYHEDHHFFPEGTIQSSSLPPEKRFSWLAGLSWGGGQGFLLNRTKSWDEEENRNVRVTINGQIEENFLHRHVLCPSNPRQGEPGWPNNTHFVGIAGLGKDVATRPLNSPEIGCFGYDRKISLKDIKDGAGNTIIVAETAWEIGPWTAGGHPTVRGLDPDGLPYLGPKSQFGGNHRGGANFCFADCSIRFLKETIDPKVLEALSTIAGGEEVDPTHW